MCFNLFQMKYLMFSMWLTHFPTASGFRVSPRSLESNWSWPSPSWKPWSGHSEAEMIDRLLRRIGETWNSWIGRLESCWIWIRRWRATYFSLQISRCSRFIMEKDQTQLKRPFCFIDFAIEAWCLRLGNLGLSSIRWSLSICWSKQRSSHQSLLSCQNQRADWIHNPNQNILIDVMSILIFWNFPVDSRRLCLVYCPAGLSSQRQRMLRPEGSSRSQLLAAGKSTTERRELPLTHPFLASRLAFKIF